MTAVIPVPAAVSFDYAAIGIDAATVLRQRAGQIRDRIRTTTEAIIEIGRALNEVKDLRLVDHGVFVEWVEAECGLNIRSAERYMLAAKFAEGKNDTVSFLPPATSYKLAARSTPKEIVDTVISRAEAGEVVPPAVVSAMVQEARSQKWQERRAANRKSKSKPRPVVEESQHDRDLRMLLGVWGAACENAHAEFIKIVCATPSPSPARGKDAICRRVREAIWALSGLPTPEAVITYLRGTDEGFLIAERLPDAARWLSEFSELWPEDADASGAPS